MKLLLSSLLSAALLYGCGSSTQAPDSKASASPSSQSSSQTPNYRVLDRSKIESTLLSIDKLPTGYSQVSDDNDGGEKTFCDYRPPHKAKVQTSRSFSMGGGLSTEFLHVGFRQYGSDSEAKESFAALSKALQTCKSEVFNGEKLAYSLMSAPKVGDASIGVRIEADSSTLLQNFVLAGPMLINAGGGGLVNASSQDVEQVTRDQFAAYESAASR